jgi:hypothetical protein
MPAAPKRSRAEKDGRAMGATAERGSLRQETQPVDDREKDRREKLRREIERGQGELEEAMVELRSTVEGTIAKVDLRRRIAERPMPWLAGAFAIGLLIGLRRR